MKLLADIPLNPGGNPFKGIGTIGSGSPDQAPGIFTRALSTTIGVITAVGIIWFTFTLIIGAIGILTSGGDQKANESARQRITTGLIGLVVLIAALFIVDILGNIFGIQDILNPVELLNQITQ